MDGHGLSELLNRHVGSGAVTFSNQSLVAVPYELLEKLLLCLALLLKERCKSFVLRQKETANKSVE